MHSSVPAARQIIVQPCARNRRWYARATMYEHLAQRGLHSGGDGTALHVCWMSVVTLGSGKYGCSRNRYQSILRMHSCAYTLACCSMQPLWILQARTLYLARIFFVIVAQRIKTITYQLVAHTLQMAIHHFCQKALARPSMP